MEAKAMSFTFIGAEGSVKIPFFQREYVWKKDNWMELLQDLLNVKKSHFLGSIIVKHQKKQSGKASELLIIDGQQRLTTLSILIKALYDSFSEEVKRNCEPTLMSYLYYKEAPTDKNHIVKIKHSHNDACYFTRVVALDNQEKLYKEMAESTNKIFQCYKFFFDYFKDNNEFSNVSLFNKILDKENKILVIIDLDENEDEQAIFDTINSSGVRLSGADIVKNALFQRAIELFPSDESEVVKLYEDNWKNVFVPDDEGKAYWESERSTGRLMRNNLELLLHAIAVINGFYKPEEHTLSDLSKLYKIRISELKSKEEMELFIKEIKQYALLYKNKILNIDKTTVFSFDDSIQRLSHILETLEITTFQPFILYLLKKHNDNDEPLKKVLFKLEKLIINRMITKSEAKSYNKWCVEFIKDETVIDSKLSEVEDKKIPLGLQDISNKNATLLLFWIELYRRSADNKYDMKELKYVYTLEHVMPQKWEEFWSLIPAKINDDGSNMTLDEARKDRAQKIYFLGNMTLLTNSLNPSLRNYDFDKKVSGDNRKKGMKDYSSLSITLDDFVTPFLNGDKVWDESRIINRTNSLAATIKKIW